MTASPATADPGSSTSGTEVEAAGTTADEPSLPLAESVSLAAAGFGAEAITATDLVDAILSRQVVFLRDAPTTPVPWPAEQSRQTAERWLHELRPLVAPDRTVFGRLAATCLWLLDAAVARQAERSGLLFGLASTIEDGVDGFLTPVGRRLLLRRAPIAALGLGLLPHSVEQIGVSGEGQVRRIALARQPQRDDVGRWAAAYDRGFYVGNGPSSSRVLEGAPVAALGWSRRGRVQAVLSQPSGPGLMRYDPASEALETVDQWPGTEVAAVSEELVVAAADGRLVVGPTDGGAPPPTQTLPGPIAALVVGGERVAVVSDGRLHLRSGSEWLDAGRAGPETPLAATERVLVIGGSDGEVRGLAWSEDGRGRKIRGPRQAFAVTPFPSDPPSRDDGSFPEQSDFSAAPIELLAAGGDLVVAAGRRQVAVLSGESVVARWETSGDVAAVALSPDATAMAVATPDAGLRIWRIDGQRDLRLTAYTADSPDGDDLLGIDPTVDALAALVSARAMTPPLSVGLFGAWGSGKSFFLQRLETRVARLADESRASGRSQRSLWAWRNIRQVRFNAWHYASADVWAGMLEQLVRELSGTRSRGLELPVQLAELQRRRVERLAGAQAGELLATQSVQQAEQHLHEAQAKVEEAQEHEREQALAAAQARDRPAQEQVSEKVLQTAEAAVKDAGLEPLVASVEQVVTQLAAARRSVDSLRGLVRGGGRGRLLLAVLTGPALALLVALIAWAIEPSLTAAAAAISWLAGTLTALAGWLGRATSWVDARIRSIDEAEGKARAEWAAARQAARDAERQAVEAAVAVKAAEAEAAKAAQEVTAAGARAAAAGAGDLLAEYLEGRQTSDDYRSRLGLIGTVRADLEVISDAVALHNDKLLDDDVVNRVVLYVDDLDRCPPAVVVKVLEAVHLLLSYPLFVVVVAVDAHWVSKSLATVYPTLLAGGGVTPDNYLEKIFQLPIWLDPPSPEAATAMALALLAPPAGDGEGATASRETTPAPETAAGAGGDGSRGQVPRPRTPPDAAGDVVLAPTPPASVVVEPDERTAIGRLAPLLGRSPRALKRYLNTYRLLKAVLPSDDLARARILLAVATGRPDIGERLLDTVRSAEPPTPLGGVVDAWSHSEREWLTSNLPAGVRWREYTCGELAPVAAQVRRFVFRASVDALEPEPR